MGARYVGGITGGGPSYRVVHLNGDTRDCSRANLKYAPPHPAEIQRHMDAHAEILMRDDGNAIRRTRPENWPARQRFALYAADDGYDEPPSGRGSLFKRRSESQLREAPRWVTLPLLEDLEIWEGELMKQECRNGHAIRGPKDRTADGECRHCGHARGARYRDRQRTAMALLRGLESRGIVITKDTTHRVVTLLEALNKANPALVEAFVEQADSDQLRSLLTVAGAVPTTGRWG
ncbi:hypothetical protein BST36_00320 [Mycolicibacterium moriokaense]|nr:hypothetical protein BST36_00320 [Mycolicibacterium moriokaense]